MKYPAFNEYQAALQHPSRCFSPSGLKECIVEADLWGLPRVRSGGFALTYKLSDGKSTWAVRCFHKHVPDREERYQSINQFIQRSKIDYLESIQYVSAGINIKGNAFPITFMKWVEGETLEAFVIRHLDQPEVIGDLASKFYALVLDLEKRKITHGDLSHHNIMVRKSKLVLVDYDGMNVPEMRQKTSCEIGNPHFQHPGRDETIFDQTTDRFSSIVIFLALKTLSIDPKTWYHYETGGEGLLFKRDDFENPFQSPLLQEMETIAALSRDVRQFRQVCLADVRQVPRLEEFINGLGIEILIEPTKIQPTETVKPVVLDAQKKFLFNARLGEFVTVAGRIDEVFAGESRDHVPHVFLNFGNWKVKCFTVVLWDEALSLLNSTDITIDSFANQWVTVTGLLTAYRRRPQIIVNTPFDIEILDEDRVSALIEESSSRWFQNRSAPKDQRIVKRVPHQEVKFREPENLERGIPHLDDETITGNPLDIKDDVVGRLNVLYRQKPSKDMD